jgi:hypothetical protein
VGIWKCVGVGDGVSMAGSSVAAGEEQATRIRGAKVQTRIRVTRQE